MYSHAGVPPVTAVMRAGRRDTHSQPRSRAPATLEVERGFQKVTVGLRSEGNGCDSDKGRHRTKDRGTLKEQTSCQSCDEMRRGG